MRITTDKCRLWIWITRHNIHTYIIREWMHQSKVSIFDWKAHIDIMKHEVLPRQICRFISSLVLANSTDQHCRTSALGLMIHSFRLLTQYPCNRAAEVMGCSRKSPTESSWDQARAGTWRSTSSRSSQQTMRPYPRSCASATKSASFILLTKGSI